MTSDLDALVVRAIERMEDDPFIDDIREQGTTQQGARIAYYAEVALSEAAAAITALREENERLRDAGVAMALAAGKLNVALDGQERYRRHREAVLVAMEDFHSACARSALG